MTCTDVEDEKKCEKECLQDLDKAEQDAEKKVQEQDLKCKAKCLDAGGAPC